MNRFPAITWGLVLLVAQGYSQIAAPRKLRAGAAKAEFTPKQSELKISTDSIRDALYARAIVIDNGNTCAVLVGLDLGGDSEPDCE
jgi:hypothetical protein